jgi:hypothetical protein
MAKAKAKCKGPPPMRLYGGNHPRSATSSCSGLDDAVGNGEREHALRLHRYVVRRKAPVLSRGDTVDQDRLHSPKMESIEGLDAKRLRKPWRNRNAHTNPEEAVGPEGRLGRLAILSDQPRAIVKLRISPAQLPIRVVAEVVAHRRDRIGLLRTTDQLCRTCEENGEEHQESRPAGRHP